MLHCLLNIFTKISTLSTFYLPQPPFFPSCLFLFFLYILQIYNYFFFFFQFTALWIARNRITQFVFKKKVYEKIQVPDNSRKDEQVSSAGEEAVEGRQTKCSFPSGSFSCLVPVSPCILTMCFSFFYLAHGPVCLPLTKHIFLQLHWMN